MSVPLSAADVLGEHVAFELECIDRMYCNAYVRKLTFISTSRNRSNSMTHPFTCLSSHTRTSVE
jgi:hypothetical protein